MSGQHWLIMMIINIIPMVQILVAFVFLVRDLSPSHGQWLTCLEGRLSANLPVTILVPSSSAVA